MKKRLLVLLVFSLLLIAACATQELEQPVKVEKISDESEAGYDSQQNYNAGEDLKYQFSLLESQIDKLIADGNQIGPDRYQRLNERLESFEGEITKEEIEALRQKLLKLNPEQHGEQYDRQQGSAANTFKRGLLSPRGCEGTGSRMLGASPIDLEELQKILPMGIMSSVHITPTDHQYFHTLGYFGPSDDKTNLDRFNVYAPADGYIVDIEFHEDHRIVIEHSCTFYTIFIHVDKIADKILSSIKKDDGDIKTHVWPRIPVKEGEIIGTVGIGKFDFSVVDESVTLQGFVNPQTYEGEPWKIHTVDTFDYYDEPLKSRLLEKNVRNVEPLGGKIDYDIDGRLIGNWFKQNTNGYKGAGNWNYWTSHLSVVYDALDTSHIEVSIGDFGGEGRQYGVKGNAPKPEDVSVGTGIVKYELVPYDYYSDNKKWDGIEFAENIEARNTEDIRGVALFQLTGDRKLKAEFFPNKKGSEANGFTGNALIYER
ncbi:MAG: hypothetical protein AABX34_03975 [Nanoarchaeota archaeon]